MAGRSIQEILAPLVIRKTISRIAMPGTSLSQLFRWNLGSGPIPGAVMNVGGEEEGNLGTGGNTEYSDVRSGYYDIFDNTRTIATGRAPGQPSHHIEPQRVGSVNFTIPRSAESLSLKYESIHNRRKIGESANMIDRAGERYIEKQKAYMAARVANLIELQTAGMLRGKYYMVNTAGGDTIYQSLVPPGSGDYLTIDYQVPAGNRGQLDLTGDGAVIDATWANPATDINAHILAINKAFIENTGQGLKHIVMKSSLWAKIVNNTKLQSQGGTVNRVWDSLQKDEAGRFVAKIRAVPWVDVHIIDYGLDVYDPTTDSTSFVDMLDDDVAVFLPEINPTWCTYMLGGEMVVEGPNGRESFQKGFYGYAYPTHDPAGWRMTQVHNGFPALLVPKAVAYGTVVFT